MWLPKMFMQGSSPVHTHLFSMSNGKDYLLSDLLFKDSLLAVTGKHQTSFCQRFADLSDNRQSFNEVCMSPNSQSSGSVSEALVQTTTTTTTEEEADEPPIGVDAFYTPGGEAKATQFLTELSQILLNYYVKQLDRNTKVVDFHHPHQLREMMAHCLDIDHSPRDLEQLLSDCKETLKYCVKTGHAHFFNQLSTGLDVIGVAGEWLTAMSNTNMFTYEVAPVFTLMEEVVLNRMLAKVGWEGGDGIFAPGGAISNLYGVLLARHHAFPQAKSEGMPFGTRPVVFTSEHSHYSIRRACAILGIGTNNCVKVPCDYRGKMILSELERLIVETKAAGKTPIMVNAMAGTTVLGAYDNLEGIADICEKQGLWMHVDGAWGGSVLMSQDYRHLCKGIDRADSMTWNPHKMMGTPLQCSAILSRHKGSLQSANQMCADYLFQPDKNYDTSYDTGDKTIQCGRHNDIFKIWLMWRAKGDEGFQNQINHNFEMAKYLRDSIRDHEGFHLCNEDFEGPNICFWYIPPAWRHIPFQQIPREKMTKVAPTIKGRMMEAGTTMVQYQPLGDLPNLFRVALSNPIVTTADIDFLVNEIDRLGRDIE